MKTCTKCNTTKPLTEFDINNLSKDKLHSNCKTCRKLYRQNNKHITQQYRSNTKTTRNLKRNQYLQNPLLKFKENTRKNISKALKRGYTNKSKLTNILGCSYQEFKLHIENQFTNNMSWDNYGTWELDHIKPLAKANNINEVIKLNHYSNLQPLMKIDNQSKGFK